MDEDDQAGKSAKGRARQTVSDKRQLSGPSAKRKKTNMNIRTAILYRKNFATLIEESVSGPFTVPGVPVHDLMSGSRKYPFFDTHLP
jgi:zinc finger HIT domain-containing protein 1